MRTRARSAFLMVPLLAFVFLGGYFLMAGVFVLSLLAINEFCAAFGEKRPAKWVLVTSLILLYCGVVVLNLDIYHGNNPYYGPEFLYECVITPYLSLNKSGVFWIWAPLWTFLSLILAFISMFSMEKRDLPEGLATIAGVFYINFLAIHLTLVDIGFPAGSSGINIGDFIRIPGLHSYVWIVVLAAFGTDIFAYFTGKLFGKHKLCPSISPKKTVEGSIGGVAGSVVLCGLFGYFFLPGGFVVCIIIGIVGGIVSQLGDLSASVMKRKMGIKDWSSMIPGHGGVLDRIDSLLFTAPMVYYILLLKEWFIN